MSVWKSAPIGSFCTTGTGGTPSRAKMDRYYTGGTVPWVKSGELRETIINGTEEHVTDAALAETRLKIVPAGALLLAMYGATVGRMGILGVPATTNQAVCHLIPKPGVADVRYLFHALGNQVLELIARGVGGAQPNISQGIVKDIRVPLPPLAEQQRIASILDRADALRAKRRAALAQFDTLTQSIFLEMFGDPVTNSMGWPEGCTLGDAAEIVSGVTKGRNLEGKKIRSVPYLTVANVQDRSLDLTGVRTIDATDQELERLRLRRNDLLLTEGGDPDKLGRGALWNDEVQDCIHQNHVFRVRLTSSDVHPIFLAWLVGSQRGKRYFLKSAKQTTGIASINMSQLRAFPLFVPPIERQREFVSRTRACEVQAAHQRISLAHFDTLFASLQHRAFRGEL